MSKGIPDAKSLINDAQKIYDKKYESLENKVNIHLRTYSQSFLLGDPVTVYVNDDEAHTIPTLIENMKVKGYVVEHDVNNSQDNIFYPSNVIYISRKRNTK